MITAPHIRGLPSTFIALCVAASIALAGCGHTSGPGHVEVPKTVLVPRPVPCVDPADVPAAPRLRTLEELLAAAEYSATHALWADYIAALNYIDLLEPIARECSRIAPASAKPLP